MTNRSRTPRNSRLRWETLLLAMAKDREGLIMRLERNTHFEPGPMLTLCCIWDGYRRKDNGYPTINFRFKGRHVQMSVHELFAMMILQRAITPGKDIDHECGNRACVRHLQEVTHKHNTELRDARRSSRGAPPPAPNPPAVDETAH